MEKIDLKSHVILVDADYVDEVAQGFIRHFSERLGRELPLVDMPLWLICCALDSGLEEGDNQVQVIFVHSKDKKQMQSFAPSDLAKELNGTAFRDARLGEFLLSAVPDESVNNGAPLIVQCLDAILTDKKVKRLAVVSSKSTCRLAQVDVLTEACQRIAYFISMEDDSQDGFETVNMGYGLMHALQIDPSEL